jgi:hypothetical protein
VERAIAANMIGTDQSVARSGWLLRAASLAVPNHKFESIPMLMQSGSYRLQLLKAWHEEDVTAARRVLADLRKQRQRGGVRSFDVSTDGLYTEAAILAALGDSRGAVSWLDPTLDSLSLSTSHSLANVPRAGSLVRAMILRAELADRLGDSVSARRWASPAAILWSDADEFLRPTVTRMHNHAITRKN